MADFNAKVGSDNSGNEKIMGKKKHRRGETNENGEMFADFCSNFNCVTRGSMFLHKETHKATWVSPNITENQK